MADEKLNTGPGEGGAPGRLPLLLRLPGPRLSSRTDYLPHPSRRGPASQRPVMVVSFDKINELMNEKRQTAQAEVEKEGGSKGGRRNAGEEPPAAGDG